jgi:hypothetical protein
MIFLLIRALFSSQYRCCCCSLGSRYLNQPEFECLSCYPKCCEKNNDNDNINANISNIKTNISVILNILDAVKESIQYNNVNNLANISKDDILNISKDDISNSSVNSNSIIR